eukprot:1161106-Pelagomonas_calceolata.AAC.7
MITRKIRLSGNPLASRSIKKSSHRPPDSECAEADGKLITAQNPASVFKWVWLASWNIAFLEAWSKEMLVSDAQVLFLLGSTDAEPVWNQVHAAARLIFHHFTIAISPYLLLDTPNESIAFASRMATLVIEALTANYPEETSTPNTFQESVLGAKKTGTGSVAQALGESVFALVPTH